MKSALTKQQIRRARRLYFKGKKTNIRAVNAKLRREGINISISTLHYYLITGCAECLKEVKGHKRCKFCQKLIHQEESCTECSHLEESASYDSIHANGI